MAPLYWGQAWSHMDSVLMVSPDTLLSSTRLKNLTVLRWWELMTLELFSIPEICHGKAKGTRVETDPSLCFWKHL